MTANFSCNTYPRPFTGEEYVSRLARVRAKMESQGFDVLFISSEAEMAYMTGYQAYSEYVPQLLVAFQDREPLLFLRDMDVCGALHSTWLAEGNVVGYAEKLIGNPDVSPYDFMLDQIKRYCPAGTTVGLDLNTLTAQNADRFRNALSGAVLKDSDSLVSWVRLVKSPAEVEIMRQAGKITSAAMIKAGEVIRPGVRECDAAAEICAALARGTEEYGGHNVLAPLMPAGTCTGAAHMTWTDRPYVAGEHVNMELGGDRHRYIAANMRSFSLGQPSDKLLRLHEASREGLEAALGVIKPGALCEDVAIAYGNVVNRHGFEKQSRCGYPIGIDWLEATASLHKGDLTPLEENMTFHIMLGMWVERDFGYVISETIRVSADGCECLTHVPRDLKINT